MAVVPILALAALFVFAPFAADAATPFDGVWVGRSVTEYGRCPHVYNVTLRILDGEVTGRMVTGYERITVASRVDARGRMAHIFGYNGRTVLKTTGGRLDVQEGRIGWYGHESYLTPKVDLCYGVITLKRVGQLP